MCDGGGDFGGGGGGDYGGGGGQNYDGGNNYQVVRFWCVSKCWYHPV